MTLSPGASAPIEILVQGEVTCSEGQPPAIRLVASQSRADHPNGTLWAFDRGSFTVDWSSTGSDRYTVDANVTRTILGDVTPAKRSWTNVTWSGLAEGSNTTDPTGNGSACGWPRARDAMAIIVPASSDDADDGPLLAGPGAVATAAVVVAAAATRRRR